MKKIILVLLILQTSFFHYAETLGGELKVSSGKSNEEFNYKKAYFAGGCFWCMEESFDKVDGNSLTNKDESDLMKALDMGVDWVALSFVQQADDIYKLKGDAFAVIFEDTGQGENDLLILDSISFDSSSLFIKFFRNSNII